MIYIGADHRGFEQKKLIMGWLKGQGMECLDMGALNYDPEDDYNDYAVRVARQVAKERDARGILVCGSGHGECIQANRFRGVRAINGLTPELARVGREHNDANVLCLGADFVPKADEILKIFFGTDFLGDKKYIERNHKLDEEV